MCVCRSIFKEPEPQTMCRLPCPEVLPAEWLRHRKGISALLAFPQRLAAVESFNYLLELLSEIDRREFLIVDNAVALGAIPAQVMIAANQLRLLDDDTVRIGRPFRTVRHPGGEGQDFTLADGHIARLAVLDYAQRDIALH